MSTPRRRAPGTRAITLEIPAAELAEVDAAAKRAGLTRSSYLRMCALERARQGA